MRKNANTGQLILRIALGLLFIVPGIMKLLDTSGIAGMLGGIGFPAPLFFAWVVLLVEIIFGICVLIGWRVDISAWPLLVIVVIGTILSIMGMQASNPMTIMAVLWHLLGVAALLSLVWTGPGRYRV